MVVLAGAGNCVGILAGYRAGLSGEHEVYGETMEAIKPLEPNHKGETCPYKLIICQEGYCSECQIWREKQEGK